VLEAVEDNGAGTVVVNVVLDLALADLYDLGEDAEEVVGDGYVKTSGEEDGND